MTGRGRILAAFGPGGTAAVGAVTCYDGIFIRDHWFDLTTIPWWFWGSGVVEQELAWARDVVDRSGLEWLAVGPCPTRADGEAWRYEQRPDGVWRIDARTGDAVLLNAPRPSGTNTGCARDQHVDLERLPTTTAAVDALVGTPAAFDAEAFHAEGRHDVAVAMVNRLGLFSHAHVSSPLSSLYGYWGYEGLMLMIADHPDVVCYAGARLLDHTRRRIREYAACGVDAVWIEELFTDQIRPAVFEELNLPLVRGVVDAIRLAGLKSVYYYCGDPLDRFGLILAAGADAVHFEESKKGFMIEIEEVVSRVAGRCVVFGNLDSIGVLQRGSDAALAAEVRRQLAAGRRNGGRFVMSTGSPITPETPVARVKRYTDLVRAEAG